MKRINYYLFKIIVFVIAYLPNKIIYLLSDFMAFVLFKGIKYRKKVLVGNLQKAFPHYDNTRIQKIAYQAYQNLSDIILESCKAYVMSKNDFLQQYRVVNPELADSYFKKNQSVIVVGSHFANWEWGVICVPLQQQHQLLGVYRPLANTYINNFMHQSRANFGMKLYATKHTAQAFADSQKQASAIILMADQSPSKVAKAHWVNFLNRDTACIHGPAKYAKRYNYPILYFDVQRIKRGHYTMRLSTLIDNPEKYSELAITQAYMKKLEGIITQMPANWLWTHKRWKKQR